ncbi:MAG TPA: hypothetical protein VFC29_10270 [Candidatus Limnocylindrales bacterium]|nr:hypothetical protein [Candidatus Limnocylindrales bacterium]
MKSIVKADFSYGATLNMQQRTTGPIKFWTTLHHHHFVSDES